MERLPFGKTIRMPCMRKGLCAYPDEVILLGQDVLTQMSKTAHGIPVVIEHPGVPIDEESIESIGIHGRVSSMDYDAERDEWFANFVVDTKEAVELLQSGYGVSTAWYGEKYGHGGTMNNVPYDKELMGAVYEHLAIVQSPRYEMAMNPIFMNSKDNSCKVESNMCTIEDKQSDPAGGKQMKFSLWRNKRDEIKVNEGDEVMVNVGGEEKKLNELIEEYKKSKEEPAKKASKVLTEEDMVDIDGVSMSVKELIAAVQGRKEASVQMDVPAKEKLEGFDLQDKDDKAGLADAVKGNGDDADEDDKEEAKTNSRFQDLKEAHENGKYEEPEEAWISTNKRVEMGKLRYGSAAKTK